MDQYTSSSVNFQPKAGTLYDPASGLPLEIMFDRPCSDSPCASGRKLNYENQATRGERIMESNPYGGDWLEVDASELPTNQLPLLQSMIGRRLVNIQRSIRDSLDEYRSAQQTFFRKAWGPVIIEMEDMPPIYFDDSKYHTYEISISVSTEPFPLGFEAHGLARRYTLNDSQYVDDRLSHLPGQRLLKMRILIREPNLPRDKAQALQDGIEMTFEDGTTIIVSYYLNALQAREFQILYPEEIPWHTVEYIVDVARPRISWRYRFNRWKWRALDRLARRLDLH